MIFLQKELATYWQVSLYKKLALDRSAFYNCTSCDWNVMEQLTKQLVSPLVELKGGQGRNILNTICLKFIPRRINFKALLNLMFAKIYRGGQYVPWKLLQFWKYMAHVAFVSWTVFNLHLGQLHNYIMQFNYQCCCLCLWHHLQKYEEDQHVLPKLPLKHEHHLS